MNPNKDTSAKNRSMQQRRFHRSCRKIFCVGRNKTGTTSLAAASRSLGFKVGNQSKGELLLRDWARRNFSRLIELCKTADVFQDVPFSLNCTYVALDMYFPHSRFILSVRDSSQQWFRSYVRFHTEIVGKERRPNTEDLREFGYRYKGYLWDVQRLVYGADEGTLYDEDLYIRNYESHNEAVKEYFRHRPSDLLVLNLAEPDAMKRLCSFLEIEFTGQEMPHIRP